MILILSLSPVPITSSELQLSQLAPLGDTGRLEGPGLGYSGSLCPGFHLLQPQLSMVSCGTKWKILEIKYSGVVNCPEQHSENSKHK